MKKFFIGIPTINRADLLNEALIKYAKDFPNIHIMIIDNGNQNIWMGADNIFVFNFGVNYGVAKSWNWLMRKGFAEGYENALILNDDVYLGRNESQISELIENFPQHGFFVGIDSNWSAFIVRQSTFDAIGGFDENFYPAYFEDNDFCYRMRLNGITRESNKILTSEIYRNSMTIQKNPELNANFEKNRQYFIAKWGGAPSKETFKTPFNR